VVTVGELGTTVGSLISLSIDPPSILFSVQFGTHFHGAVQTHPYFGVSILAEGQAELAQRFSGPYHNRMVANWPTFHQVAVAQGAVTWLRVSREMCLEATDHLLVTAKVDQIQTFSERVPLIYSDRSYGIFNSR
jgi:flavin reductase (DIM6/NTAB) family NADH-FMN oxidoreductase RutF